MFENEYKEMIDNITPSAELLSGTLVNARAAAQGKRTARRAKGSLVLASVLILGLICVTAIALTPPKVVNWSGETVQGVPQVIAPTADTNHLIIKEMMRQKPENEMWQVDSPNQGRSASYPSKFFESMSEMQQYIKDADDDIFVPYSVPKGYQYVSGNIVFFASIKTILAGVIQLPTETLIDGTTIKKWKVSDICKNDISFYHIGLKDENGNVLDIFFRREEAEASDSTRFFVLEGGSSENVNIDGMDRALYVNIPTSLYNHALHLLHTSAKQKEWYDWPMFDNPDQGLDMPVDYESKRTYTYANYSICSTSLDKNALVEIAQSMR